MNRDDYYEALQHSALGYKKPNAKYIDRKMVNGRWQYTYKDDTSTNTHPNQQSINDDIDKQLADNKRESAGLQSQRDSMGRRQSNYLRTGNVRGIESNDKTIKSIDEGLKRNEYDRDTMLAERDRRRELRDHDNYNNTKERQARTEARSGDNLDLSENRSRDLGRVQSRPGSRTMTQYKEKMAKREEARQQLEARDVGRRNMNYMNAAKNKEAENAQKEAGQNYKEARDVGRRNTNYMNAQATKASENAQKEAGQNYKDAREAGRAKTQETLYKAQNKEHLAQLEAQKQAAAGRREDGRAGDVNAQYQTRKKQLAADEKRKSDKWNAEKRQHDSHDLAQEQKVTNQKSANEKAKRDVNADDRRDKVFADKTFNNGDNDSYQKKINRADRMERRSSYNDLYTSEYKNGNSNSKKYNTTHATR